MKQRRYAVDDMDFDQYKATGGTMSRAEYFNARLSGQAVTDSLSVRLADHLGARSEPQARNLEERITRQLLG